MTDSKYPKPEDDELRLEELRRLDILDTPAELRFDRLTRWASNVLGCPIALVSLVDEKRQWFKSIVGLDAQETPREQAFCNFTVTHNEIFEVTDAKFDERFKDNPLVTCDPGIRYYAGAPIISNGHAIGSLCVIDREPHKPMDRLQREALIMLAKEASKAVETRDQLTKSHATLDRKKGQG